MGARFLFWGDENTSKLACGDGCTSALSILKLGCLNLNVQWQMNGLRSGTYIQQNTNQPFKKKKKKRHNAICSNTDMTRDSHSKRSMSEKDKYRMMSLNSGIKNMAQTNLSTKQKQMHGHRE